MADRDPETELAAVGAESNANGASKEERPKRVTVQVDVDDEDGVMAEKRKRKFSDLKRRETLKLNGCGKLRSRFANVLKNQLLVISTRKGRLYVQRAFFCLSSENPVRRFLVRVVDSYLFDRILLLTVFVNAFVISLGDRYLSPRAIYVADMYFNVIFLIEMIFKWTAYGVFTCGETPNGPEGSLKLCCARQSKISQVPRTSRRLEIMEFASRQSNAGLEEGKQWILASQAASAMAVRARSRATFGSQPKAATRVRSYFGDPWNVLDFVLVLSGYVYLIPGVGNFSAVRMFRVLRPLRAVNRMRRMKVMVVSLLSSLPALSDVMLLFCFLLSVFGLIGVQLYHGKFQSRCAVYSGSLPSIVDPDRVCSYDDGSGYNCEAGETCVPGISRNPQFGFLGFDHLPMAFLTIFTLISMEGWSDVLYYTTDGASNYHLLYHIGVVLLGAFFAINLIVAVLFVRYRFHQTDSDAKYQKKKEKAEGDLRVQQSSKDEQLEMRPEEVKPGDPEFVVLHNKVKLRSKLNCWNRKVVLRIQSFVNSRVAKVLIFCVILLQFLSQLTWYQGMTQSHKKSIVIINLVVCVVYIFEIVLVFMGKGSKHFLSNGTRIFNTVLVVFSLIWIVTRPIGQGLQLTALLSLRSLEVFSLLEQTVAMRKILWDMRASLRDMASFVLVFGTYIFMMGLVGMRLFGDTYQFAEAPVHPRPNFDDVANSMLSIFQVLTRENWNTQMYHAMRSKPVTGAVFFVLVFTFGAYLLMSLFVAILLGNFASSLPDHLLTQEEREKKVPIATVRDTWLWRKCGCGREGKRARKTFKADDEVIKLQEQMNIQASGSSIGDGASVLQSGSLAAISHLTRRSPNISVALPPGSLGAVSQARRRSLAAASRKASNAIQSTKPSLKSNVTSRSSQDGIEAFSTPLLPSSHPVDVDAPAATPNSVSVVSSGVGDDNDDGLKGTSVAGGIATTPTNKLDSPSSTKANNGTPYGTQGDAPAGHLPTKSPLTHGAVDQEHRPSISASGTPLMRAGAAKSLNDEVGDSQHRTSVIERMRHVQEDLQEGLHDAGAGLGHMLHLTHVAEDRKERVWQDVSAPRLHCTSPLLLACLAQEKHQQKVDNEVKGVALCCLGPDSRFRQIMHSIATSKGFTIFVVVLVLVSSIVLAVDRVGVGYAESTLAFVISWLDYFLTGFFVIEMLVKMIAFGLWSPEGSYFHHTWNYFDFTVTVFMVLSLAFESVLPWTYIKVMRAVRALRPLRVASWLKPMKLVADSVLFATPEIVNVLIVGVLLCLCLGLVGVQLFAGRLSKCLDIDRAYVGAFTREQCEALGGGHHWGNPMSGHFDHAGAALLVVYEITTLEMWPEVLWTVVDSSPFGAPPVADGSLWPAWYFIVVISAVGFFIVSFFVGVVAQEYSNNYDKITGHAGLTLKQKQWLETQKLIFDHRPRTQAVPPKRLCGAHLLSTCDLFIRKCCFRVVTHPNFNKVILFLVGLNVLLMFFWYPTQSMWWSQFQDVVQSVFVGLFFVELLFKLLGLGLRQWVKSKWNIFDGIIAVLAVAAFFVEIVQQRTMFGLQVKLMRICGIVRIFRFVKRVKRLKSFTQTLVFCLPALYNGCALLLLVFYVYAIVGMNIWGKVKPGEYLNRDANFKTFPRAMLTLFRMSTGESWNGIMHDCMKQPPQCMDNREDCGSMTLGLGYFITFNIICSFVLLNVFVGIVLKRFEHDVQVSTPSSLDMNGELTEDNSPVAEADIDDYAQTWLQFSGGSLNMPVYKLPNFLSELRPPLGLKDQEATGADLIAVMSQLQLPNRKNNTVHALEVANALSLRVFDATCPGAQLGLIPPNTDLLKLLHANVTRLYPELTKQLTATRFSAVQCYAAIRLQSSWRRHLIFQSHNRRNTKDPKEAPGDIIKSPIPEQTLPDS